MPLTNFEKALQQAQNLNVEYVPVQFPLKHYGGNSYGLMVSGSKEYKGFEMSGPGATYITHSIGADSIQTDFPPFKSEPRAFTDMVNEWASMTSETSTFVAIIVDGFLYGLPKNYNIVPHETVLEFIKEMGLHEYITDFKVTAYEMILYIRDAVKHEEGQSYSYGVRVSNGMTGHVTLAFNSYLKVGKEFILDFPDSRKVKHLSKVDLWDSEFQEASQEFIATSVDTALCNMSAVEAIEFLERFRMIQSATNLVKISNVIDKIVEWEDVHKNQPSDLNSLDVLIELSSHIKYGQKPLVRKAMNYITAEAIYNQELAKKYKSVHGI